MAENGFRLIVTGVTHLAIKFFHGHQVQGFERVSCGSDEVQASVDAGVVVVVQGALDFQLLL